ncbi:hypothetical protein [Streptomyces sp. NPDC049879]|uniref:hypothetical protein n=1 Tax=Streptomyces sp. NPDC049879 TaxID=3365598 RepID=UPI00379812B0
MTDELVDMRRELEKARDTLASVELHLARQAEANAALHCATRVIYSPLHSKVAATRAGIDRTLGAPAADPRFPAAGADLPTDPGGPVWTA